MLSQPGAISARSRTFCRSPHVVHLPVTRVPFLVGVTFPAASEHPLSMPTDVP